MTKRKLTARQKAKERPIAVTPEQMPDAAPEPATDSPEAPATPPVAAHNKPAHHAWKK